MITKKVIVNKTLYAPRRHAIAVFRLFLPRHYWLVACPITSVLGEKPPSKVNGPGPIAVLKALKKIKIALPYQGSNSGFKPISLVTMPKTPSQFPQKITN